MVRQKTPAESAQDWTLTEEQATAVNLLATGRTIGETAEALKVPMQTVSEWYRLDPGIQAELNARRQELWAGTADRLRALLPKALEVLAEEMEGENRLHAAVHVLKACKLYGAEVSIGPTEVEDVAIQEKERLQKRRHHELMVNLI